MLDKTTVREIARKYADEVKKVLNPTAILIFGSYINGNPHEWSDIDIAVIMHDYQGDWLKTYSMLFGLKSERYFIDIEPHLLDDTCDKSGFVEHVLKTGEFIYKAA
jgi:predicted nucleotidyltransferase